MDSALLGKHPAQPLVHFVRSDKLAGAAAGQDFVKRPAFQVFNFQSLAQLFNALLNDRADTGVSPGIHQQPGKGVLLVGKRN